jgi:hypothetical protein
MVLLYVVLSQRFLGFLIHTLASSAKAALVVRKLQVCDQLFTYVAKSNFDIIN